MAKLSLSSSPEAFLRQLSNENTAKTFEFNSSEAEKSRNWQEYMSNTSHQREVDDLKRAGLNPVLAANGGAQSYSASSASGTSDSSAVGMLASIYNTKMNNDNAVKIARINADKDVKTAKIAAQATKYASDNASSATRYASDNTSSASYYSTDHSKYGLIDSFVKGVLGDGSKSNSARTIGSKANGIISKFASSIVRKFKK